jgi:CHAD domain-containing protein
VKAARVKGLDPGMPLGEAAARIVRVRLDELLSLAPGALHPEQVETLHDLRIAAKRLRYLLETMAPALGPGASRAAKRAREIQDLLGEIHDCDVMAPRVLAELDALEARDGVNDPAFRGLAVLAAHLRTRRAALFERFVALWRRLEAEGALTRRGYDDPTT